MTKKEDTMPNPTVTIVATATEAKHISHDLNLEPIHPGWMVPLAPIAQEDTDGDN